MAQQSIVQVGNASICLVDADDPFRDGHSTGYLEFYDERHRPSFPLTSQMVSDYLTMIVKEPSTPLHRIAGRIAGWMEALMEHSPQTLRSAVPTERITVLQAP